MAAATEFNARLGSAGLRMFYAEVTLVSGVGTITTPLTAIKSVQVTEKASTSTDFYAAEYSGGTAYVYDSDGTSTATIMVLIVGY